MDDKREYREICSKMDVPFFLQYWWLELVCNKDWDVVLDKNKEKINGFLPYYIKKKVGLDCIGMPFLTQFMNPVLIYPQNQKNSKKLAFEKKVIQNLYKALPKVAFIKQTWDSSCRNWLPLYWLNYSQSTRYSYIIEDLTNLDLVFGNFETKIRGDIRKAEKNVEVKETNDSNILYEQVFKTFSRKGLAMPYSKELIKDIVSNCVKLSQGKIYYAKDVNENTHAAIFIVWDKNKAYYLLGGGDPEYRNSGATSLLLWNAIQELSLKVNCFDFEGSMIEEVERFIRGFGAKQIELNTISKIFSKRYYALDSIYRFKNIFLSKK